MTVGWPGVTGRLVAGHGVASGRAADSPYPAGTITLQQPLFAEYGMDLSQFYPATLNLDIAPWTFQPIAPRWSRTLNWYADVTERFSLFDARIRADDAWIQAVIYYPHPETKPAHQQPGRVVEILAPWVEGLRSGNPLELAVDPQQAAFART